MPPAHATGVNRQGSNSINKAISEPIESVKSRLDGPAMSKSPPFDPPPSPVPPPRHFVELFPPLPTSTYVHCIQRHAFLVEKMSKPSSGRGLLDPSSCQVLALVVSDILDAASTDVNIASLALPPTLRFMLQLLLVQEQRVWPNEAPSPDLVVALCGVHVLLWKVTTRVDAILARASNDPLQGASPLEEINVNLKLRLANLTEEWASVVCKVVRNTFQAVAAEKTAAANGSAMHNGTPFMTKLLHELLRPMSNFAVTVDDDNARRYVLTQLLDKTIDTTIEELVASVGRVTETDRRHLQTNIDQLKTWIDATCDKLSSLPSVKRLDRLNQEWNILGIDNRRRRSSFDIIMDTFTSDSIARFYRGKQLHQQSTGSIRILNTRSPRAPSVRKS